MKFPVTLRKDFNVEKDDMKFGFYMHVEYKISSSQAIKVKVPIMINTGIVKINASGGNISSAQSVVSGKGPAVQEQKLK